MSTQNLPNIPDKDVQGLRPFRHFCMSLGVIPSSYLEALTNEELLLWFCDFLQNKVIPTVNNNAECVQELQELFTQLRTYVNDYFTNLDVQEEINNKLDNMVENGELDPLLNNIFTSLTNQINTQNTNIQTNKNSINELSARMDTFSNLPSGSTTGDAELQDIRVGYNGTTYENAGTSVRSQISDIHNNLGDFIYNINTKASNGYVDFTQNFPKDTEIYISLKEIKSGTLEYASVYAYTNEEDYDNICPLTEDDIGQIKTIKTTKAYVKIRLFIKFTEATTNNANFIFGLMNNNTLLPQILNNKSNIEENKNNINNINETIGYYKYIINTQASNGYVDFEENFPKNTEFYISLNEIKSGTLSYASVYAYTDDTNYENICPISNEDIGQIKTIKTNKPYVKIRLFIKFTETGTNNATFVFGKISNNLISLILNNNTKDLSLNKHTARIFKKVCCVGDSYTAGYIVNSEGEPSTYNENFAWPHYLSLITGNNYVNCGVSGATSKNWQERTGGLDKAQETGVVQAYLIGLAINDATSDSNGLPVGDISDIGTEKDTYYAQYSKIIRLLNNISTKAKIFVMTCPHANVPDSYNQAIKNIANQYKSQYNVHVLDLNNYKDLYNISSITSDFKSGHYTAIGYEQFAENLEYILSDYINNNIADFQDVAFLPYN